MYLFGYHTTFMYVALFLIHLFHVLFVFTVCIFSHFQFGWLSSILLNVHLNWNNTTKIIQYTCGIVLFPTNPKLCERNSAKQPKVTSCSFTSTLEELENNLNVFCPFPSFSVVSFFHNKSVHCGRDLSWIFIFAVGIFFNWQPL